MLEHLKEYWFGYVLSAIVALCFALLIAAAHADIEERRAFLAECESHEPRYKCVAMWRAGESHEQIVPVVIPMR